MDSHCQRAAGIRCQWMMADAAMSVARCDGHNCATFRRDLRAGDHRRPSGSNAVPVATVVPEYRRDCRRRRLRLRRGLSGDGFLSGVDEDDYFIPPSPPRLRAGCGFQTDIVGTRRDWFQKRPSNLGHEYGIDPSGFDGGKFTSSRLNIMVIAECMGSPVWVDAPSTNIC